PINGGVPWPKEFRSALRREGEWLSFVRPAHRLMPGYTASRKSATALLAGSTSVWEQLDGYHQKTVYVPENGIDPERFAFPETERKPGPLRIAFVGRLVPYKGADMMIDAVAP